MARLAQRLPGANENAVYMDGVHGQASLELSRKMSIWMGPRLGYTGANEDAGYMDGSTARLPWSERGRCLLKRNNGHVVRCHDMFSGVLGHAVL